MYLNPNCYSMTVVTVMIKILLNWRSSTGKLLDGVTYSAMSSRVTNNFQGSLRCCYAVSLPYCTVADQRKKADAIPACSFAELRRSKAGRFQSSVMFVQLGHVLLRAERSKAN